MKSNHFDCLTYQNTQIAVRKFEKYTIRSCPDHFRSLNRHAEQLYPPVTKEQPHPYPSP